MLLIRLTVLNSAINTLNNTHLQIKDGSTVLMIFFVFPFAHFIYQNISLLLFSKNILEHTNDIKIILIKNSLIIQLEVFHHFIPFSQKLVKNYLYE